MNSHEGHLIFFSLDYYDLNPCTTEAVIAWGQFNKTFTGVVYKFSHCYRVWKQQLHILSFIKVTPGNKAANNIKQVPSNGQGSLPTFSKYGKHQLVMKN